MFAMHYVRTLCDKYFLSYYGFSAFCMGRSRYWVMKYGVGVKWDTRRTAGYVRIPFSWFWTPCSTMWSPKIVIFHELLIVETCNKCHWIWHASNPKYVPLKPFLMHFFPVKNQQNVKFWLFPELPLTKKLKKCQFAQRKSVCKGLQICTYRFLGMPITMHYVRSLCDKYFFELLWFFCILYGKIKI